jgi:hypothetical protein
MSTITLPGTTRRHLYSRIQVRSRTMREFVALHTQQTFTNRGTKMLITPLHQLWQMLLG